MTLGFPLPTENRATTRDAFSNSGDPESPFASAVGVKVPTTHWPLAPLGRAFWLPDRVRMVVTIWSVDALCAHAGSAVVTAIAATAATVARERFMIVTVLDLLKACSRMPAGTRTLCLTSKRLAKPNNV
jgi:hypothetical protein